MKLFIYDEKHEVIIDELDLGEISNENIELLNQVFDFLEDNNITSRYKRLMLAKSYINKVNEDGFNEIDFSF